MPTLENVAKGKRAWQSSISKWSKPDDAERALADDGVRDFAFHTDADDRPWWIVDLGDQYPLHSIVVGNRRKGHQHKARTLTVEVSRDGETWQCAHQGQVFWRGDFTVPLGGEILARFVRLSLREKTYLHLAKVEVWTKRSELVAAARRDDGFGNRLRSLLNASYLAKALNCDLKISWPDTILGLAGEFANDVNAGDKVILGHSVEAATDIFSAGYVDQFVGPQDISQSSKISAREKLTAHDIFSGVANDAPGVINGPREGLEVSLWEGLAPNSQFGLPDMFEQIEFSEKMQAVITAANSVELSRKCAAVHIRSGDIVFGNYRLHGTRFLKKAVPLPLAKMAIERLQAADADVVLFGEDEHSLRYLSETYGVRLASDLGKDVEMGGATRALFDIVLMSRMDAIWAAYSGFALTALDISRKAELVKIHSHFSSEEQAQYFAADLQQNSSVYDPKQAAFAYWSLYWLSADRTVAERVAALDMATEFDPENQVYALAKASLLLSERRDNEGDWVLGEAISNGWLDKALWGGTGRTHILVEKHSGRFHLHNLIPAILDAADRGTPNAKVAKTMIEDATNG